MCNPVHCSDISLTQEPRAVLPRRSETMLKTGGVSCALRQWSTSVSQAQGASWEWGGLTLEPLLPRGGARPVGRDRRRHDAGNSMQLLCGRTGKSVRAIAGAGFWKKKRTRSMLKQRQQRQQQWKQKLYLTCQSPIVAKSKLRTSSGDAALEILYISNPTAPNPGTTTVAQAGPASPENEASSQPSRPVSGTYPPPYQQAYQSKRTCTVKYTGHRRSTGAARQLGPGLHALGSVRKGEQKP